MGDYEPLFIRNSFNVNVVSLLEVFVESSSRELAGVEFGSVDSSGIVIEIAGLSVVFELMPASM